MHCTFVLLRVAGAFSRGMDPNNAVTGNAGTTLGCEVEYYTTTSPPHLSEVGESDFQLLEKSRDAVEKCSLELLS